MDLSLQPSPSDECGNAERIAPTVSTLAEDTSTAIAQEPVLEWKVGQQEALIMMILSLTVLVPVLLVSELKNPLI